MPEKTNIIETLKLMKPRDFIYPGIFILFLIIVGIVFYNAATFISKNINKVFTAQEDTTVQGLNLERYKIVAQKLNIPVVIPAEPSEVTEAEIQPLETSPTATTTIESLTLDKKSITITVLNSTTKKGLAAALAKELEASGFTAPKTGTESKLIATTTIKIKESKYDFAAPLLETVIKSYPQAVVATTTESASSDATIIIGSR